MPQLRNEMERYLRGWPDDLSAAWRERLQGAMPCFNAIPQGATLDQGAQIVPCRRDGHGPLYALEGNDPSDVRVVVFGNDPYPDPLRATGRSFEQGDLDSWIESLSEPGRVTRSLLNLICAAVALLPDAAGLNLASPNLHGRREALRCALQNGTVALPVPRSMFEVLTGQGVLWLNRTPTISALNTGRLRRGSYWEGVEEHRKWHRALWRPVTDAILSGLVDEARTRPIVFALFGGKAKRLRSRIKSQRRRHDVPLENVRLVESGHPSHRTFFSAGNPLDRINDELASCGRESIDWCGPTARCAGEAASGASRRSIAIMDRALGRYRTTLKQLARL